MTIGTSVVMSIVVLCVTFLATVIIGAICVSENRKRNGK